MDVIPRDGERIVTQPGKTTSAGAVISRIESILESTLDCLAEGKELCIDLTTARDDQTTQRVHFPGRCAQEATKFGMHCCSSEYILCSASHTVVPSSDTSHFAARPRRSGFGNRIDQAVSTIGLLYFIGAA